MENNGRKLENGTIMMPRPDVFSGKHAVESAVPTPGMLLHIYERTEYPDEGGILVYYKDVPFPKKGFPFPDALFAIDIAKRFTLAFIQIFATKALILPMAIFAMMPWKLKWKTIENGLHQYSRMNEWIMSPVFLIKERCCPASQNVWNLVETFLNKLGAPHTLATSIARIFAMFVEYDDAYRYRLQDIMSEASYVELYTRPRKEIKRLTGLFVKRERMHAVSTVGNAVKLLSLALLHPKIRKAFTGAVRLDDLHGLILDNADRYHVLLRADYDFQGRSLEERQGIYQQFHYDHKLPYPPTVEIAMQ